MWLWIIGLLILASLYYMLKKKPRFIITDIVIYPIKSCGAVHLDSVQINEYGMLNDRLWVLMTPDNNIVTQRTDTNLLKLQPVLHIKSGVLHSVDLIYESYRINFKPQEVGDLINFDCMRARCDGIDEGESVTEFLKKAFNKDYRLIRVVKQRQINEHPRYHGLVSDEHHTNFTDCAQFLVISEASHNQTKASIPTSKKDTLDILCFRANIVVKGCRPFEEETWARFSIGALELEGIGRCPRCIVTTVDQKTLEFDEHFEPVKTLRKINGNGTKGYLGMHCVRHNNGEISVGDEIIVKETRKFPDI
jgi:uncharacterized protein